MHIRWIVTAAVLTALSSCTNTTGPEQTIPTIQVLSPSGMSTYHIGDTLHIRWTADTSLVEHVLPRISIDSGRTLLSLMELINGTHTISKTMPDWGRIDWVIPDSVVMNGNMTSVVSKGCIVSVRSWPDNEYLSQTDYFSIQ